MFGAFELDLKFAIAQLVGFVATGIAIYSFQAKHRITMLSMQTASNLLWMVHYLILGGMSTLYATAIFANFIATLRNIIYGLRGKYKFADSKIVPAVSVVAFLISGVLTYKTPFDILPTMGMILASIAFFIKEEKLIRYISVFIALSWLTYGVYAGSIAQIIADGSTLASIIVAIIRYHNFDVYEKTTSVYPVDLKTDEEYENEIEVKLSDDALENTNA